MASSSLNVNRAAQEIGSSSATTSVPPPSYMQNEGIDRFSELPREQLTYILKSIEVHDEDFQQHRKLISAVNKLFKDRLPTRTQPHRLVHLNRFKLHSAMRGVAAEKALSKWLRDAEVLGVTDLHLDIGANTLERVFGVLVTMATLDKLYLNSNCWRYVHDRILPQNVTLPGLRSMYLKSNLRDEDLERLVSLLPVLETLILEEIQNNAIILSSLSLKNFKVTYLFDSPAWYVRLSLPNLEEFECSFRIDNNLDLMLAEMPFVNKVAIHINGIEDGYVNQFGILFARLANMKELAIDVRHRQFGFDQENVPFHELVEPGTQLPTFPNLESLNLSMCMHKKNVQDVIDFIHHCPSLQSVNLAHLAPRFSSIREGTSTKAWQSRLPENEEGNRDSAYFRDLHKGSNKSKLVRMLEIERLFKKQRIEENA